MPTTLRLILGDQLNTQHSWFQQLDVNVTYLLCEARSETDYVQHHVQKVTGFFLAMRLFSKWLEEQGHQVHYLKLDASENAGSITANVKKVLADGDFTAFSYQSPDEYRLDEALKNCCATLDLTCHCVDSEHFLVERSFVEELFKNKKTYLMETFYRKVRTKYQFLMEGDGVTPLTGQWNYDKSNRNRLPKDVPLPEVPSFSRDASEIAALLQKEKVKTIGSMQATDFDWPLTRDEALHLLDHFCQYRLAHFGTYQDAMTDRHYLLFHSKLSFVLNTKILSPLEVCEAAINYWEQHQEEINIAQIEGFLRQIIGWREYMRGVYWAQMPAYAEKNYFQHNAKLPSWYWTGATKMKCLSHAITQSLEHAYAHHIQRLMVTGNFALLLGVHPDQVDAWYLGIYIDAIEWVEITNTRGMSQYADGGLLATKPYVASANYMNKMSDYCKKCAYNHKEKTGDNACPFNSLYWDFMDRHRSQLKNNARIGMAYRTWDRYESEQKEAILRKADWVKRNIETL
ncbi:MAG: cryptochrome/photolyase family protein [Lewinella sp.]|uniref:cryptochrome/photolyase family protein n=1 Tax=Lewinella sp. TaxID=2004506 RepID=UPI003D6BBA26